MCGIYLGIALNDIVWYVASGGGEREFGGFEGGGRGREEGVSR